MNDLLIEIAPYDGYKLANVLHGDVVMYQTNPGNKIAIAAKPKGLPTVAISSSNITLNLDSVSTCPLSVAKGGNDTLLEVDGDGNMWTKKNLEVGGTSLSFAEGCITCHNDAMVLEVGSDPRAVTFTTDGTVDARAFHENGAPLRSIYATVLDKAQLKNEIARCVKREDLAMYIERGECEERYMQRSKEFEIAGLAKATKRLSAALERTAVEIRENHEWTLGALKKSLTTTTATTMFVSADRNKEIDACVLKADWNSNEMMKMLPVSAAKDMFLSRDFEETLLTATSASVWGSNIIQHMLPLGRAEQMFVRVQREADIDDAFDTGMWCSNALAKCLSKKDANKMFVHTTRERDIDTAYHKAQWASNNACGLISKAEAREAFLPLAYAKEARASATWTSNSIVSLLDRRAMEEMEKKLLDVETRIEWSCNVAKNYIRRDDARSLFLSKSKELEITQALATATWSSNQTKRFVTKSDAEGYADLNKFEKLLGDVQAIHHDVMDLQGHVHWTSNNMSTVRASHHGDGGAPTEEPPVDYNKYIEHINQRIDERFAAALSASGVVSVAHHGDAVQPIAGEDVDIEPPGMKAPETEIMIGPANKFSSIRKFCDSSNNDIFEFRDGMYNPPFLTLPPTLGSASKQGLGLWSVHKRGSISFHIGDQTGYPVEHMRLTAKGFLGIGTGTPKHELEVVGTANIENIKEDGVYLHKKYATKNDLQAYVTRADMDAITSDLLKKTSDCVRQATDGGMPNAPAANNGFLKAVDGLIKIPSAMSKIKSLTGYTNTKHASLSEADVRKCYPEAIAWGGGADVMALVACLVEAVKDLSARVDAFERLP